MPKNDAFRSTDAGVSMRNGRSGQFLAAEVSKGKANTKETTVNGGTIKREAASGRFLEVRTADGTSKPTEASTNAVREASNKRSAALKRLADR